MSDDEDHDDSIDRRRWIIHRETSPDGERYILACGGDHEDPQILQIVISRAELAAMPLNRGVADQIALRADAWHWFARVKPRTVDSFSVEIVRCPSCRIAELAEIASAVGDIAVALGLPSETPPRDVVARARRIVAAQNTIGVMVGIIDADPILSAMVKDRVSEIIDCGADQNPHLMTTPLGATEPREYRREFQGLPVPPEPVSDWTCATCGATHPADHGAGFCGHGIRCRACRCSECEAL